MEDAVNRRRPTTLVLSAVGLFLLAVFLGRVLVAGGAVWVLLALALPLVLLATSAAFGIRAGLLFTLTFSTGVLGIRWLLRENPTGWIGLLLIPVVALTAFVVGRVLAQMRRRPDTQVPPNRER